MKIWYNKELKISDFSHWMKNTMGETLGMEIIELGDDFLKMKMPVDHRTHQPYGLLHGGASVALAETAGSICSALVIDHDHFIALGVEINANHIRSAREGFVYAHCKPVNLGSTIHVWDIRIMDENGKLICISRLTVAIRTRPE